MGHDDNDQQQKSLVKEIVLNLRVGAGTLIKICQIRVMEHWSGIPCFTSSYRSVQQVQLLHYRKEWCGAGNYNYNHGCFFLMFGILKTRALIKNKSVKSGR